MMAAGPLWIALYNDLERNAFVFDEADGEPQSNAGGAKSLADRYGVERTIINAVLNGR